MFYPTVQPTHLVDCLSLCDPLVPYFDSWMTQGLDEVSRVQAHQIGNFVSHFMGKYFEWKKYKVINFLLILLIID